MPDLDVTDIMLDSLVAGEPFVVVTRRENVNSYGESKISPISAEAWGSITPTGDNSLVRQEAFDLQQKSIRVVTPYFLRSAARTQGGVSYKPDLVLWNNDYYEVREISDLSSYGQGFVEASCIMIDYQPTPPTYPQPVVGQLDFGNKRSVALAGGLPCP